MAIEAETYRSFLLRLWQIEQNGACTWRCSLEETGVGERQNFASLAELMVYLTTITTQGDHPSAGWAISLGDEQTR
ncbi:MAG: hypothetical protein KC434_06260 [Anaerolineales bacterium]|nr:hypothetical protein [Anaerolineales bacterium]